ncbi:MAG: glycosyltransferase family 4 protein [Verrucomicrobia bacterium]|nr:glycosyltransferase family 4 protein [Verrucomicrobiota bacterium]
MSGRILFLDQSGQPGGAELCLADIAGNYRGRSRVLLFSRGRFEEILRERDVPVSVIDAPRSLSAITKEAGMGDHLRALPELAGFLGLLRKEIRDADLVYLNTAKALLYGVAAGLGLRKPAVFHLHDLLTSEHFSRLNIRLIVQAANQCTAVIANSTATAAACVAAGGKAPVHVIPNGFDPAQFAPFPPGEVLAARQEFHSGTGPVAAVFGRIARWKGQDVLLRAAAQIPGLKVWIVGAPFFTGDDRGYAGELRALASSPALAGRVEFLGQREDIPRLMQAADIIVHTSVAPEPFGRVVVEGMLSGKPVIASRSGGPEEIIRDGETGWLFLPGDAASLALTLQNVLALPDRGRGAGMLALDMAQKNYSLSTVLQKTDIVLSGITSR